MAEPLSSLFSDFDSIIFLDTETTGLNFRRDEIIELAAIRLLPDGTEDSQMDDLIRLSPGRRLEPRIVQLTGITDSMLSTEGVEKAESCRRFCEMLDSERPLLVAYNAQFDMNFLFWFLKANGCAEILTKVRLLDALTIYRDRRDYPHKIADAIVAYGLTDKVFNSHRAVDDTRALAEVLRAMASERDDLASYINLFGYIPKYGISGSKISSVTYLPQPYNSTARLYES